MADGMAAAWLGCGCCFCNGWQAVAWWLAVAGSWQAARHGLRHYWQQGMAGLLSWLWLGAAGAGRVAGHGWAKARVLAGWAGWHGRCRHLAGWLAMAWHWAGQRMALAGGQAGGMALAGHGHGLAGLWRAARALAGAGQAWQGPGRVWRTAGALGARQGRWQGVRRAPGARYGGQAGGRVAGAWWVRAGAWHAGKRGLR
ncbi:uncharacterized protein LOC120109045 [Phoenix dactylifera]|uniref:Uncharacterized protein LOC120109045 n=1 Tax=Phoenix dactylifera TaxID=42345 RepID=A0A8B8ZZA7_PHODC|nr:uncharacterized protein LOC120109045 [Phoenix dactylifera]